VLAVLLLVATPLAVAKEATIEIEAGTRPDGSMYLTPANFTVGLGANVTLRVTNVDSIFHDVALLAYDGRDVENEVPPKSTHDSTFVAAHAGDFRVVCEVAGHKQKGMFAFMHVVEDKSVPGVGGLAALLLVGGAALLVGRRR
jgi:uncharacterized cupredoxin-like copper-binding protein